MVVYNVETGYQQRKQKEGNRLEATKETMR